MKCKECGRIDGLKIMLDRKEIVCKQCLARLAGCMHTKLKIYRDPSSGENYGICKECGDRKEL